MACIYAGNKSSHTCANIAKKSAKWAFEPMNIFSLYRYALDFGLDLYGKFRENIIFWRFQRRKGLEKHTMYLPGPRGIFSSLQRFFCDIDGISPLFFMTIVDKIPPKKGGIYTLPICTGRSFIFLFCRLAVYLDPRLFCFVVFLLFC